MSQISKLNPQFKAAFDGLKMAKELLQKITSKFVVNKAYLFGSAAVAKNTANSDLDMLIVVPDGSEIKEYYAYVNTAFFSPVAVDWIFLHQTEYEKMVDIGGVARIATITGIDLLKGNA